MKPKQRKSIMFIFVVIALSISLLGVQMSEKDEAKTTLVRTGWQTAWATQGQVIEALQHTDILKQNGLRGEFIGFLSGPPAVEAALAGSLDVVSGGSQPILQLIAKSRDWIIVSRHANVRLGILVPPESKITKLTDLKGRQVGVPIGSTVERFVLLSARAAGLKPNDLTLVNLGITEQGELVRAGTKKSWGDFAAVGAWEPTVSLLEQKGLGRVIAEENEITLTAMSKAFIKNHPDVAVAYLGATLKAWSYYATHRSEMNEQYLKDALLPIDASMLETIAKNEPNAAIKRPEEIDISLTPEILKQLQETIDYLVERKILSRQMRIEEEVNRMLLQKAIKSFPEANLQSFQPPPALQGPTGGKGSD
jgi:sulfonate transport system substrate-binding protein